MCLQAPKRRRSSNNRGILAKTVLQASILHRKRFFSAKESLGTTLQPPGQQGDHGDNGKDEKRAVHHATGLAQPK